MPCSRSDNLLCRRTSGLAAQQYESLTFTVYQGHQNSAHNATVYEDDGATTAYVGGAAARTLVGYERSAGSLAFTIERV